MCSPLTTRSPAARHTAQVQESVITRELDVEIVRNIRHLGGYRRHDGSVTVAHTIVRAANLQRLTETGVETLRQAGITTVVDLRSDEEVTRDASPDLAQWGLKAVHAPVFQDITSPAGLAEGDFPGFAAIYAEVLGLGFDAYRTLVETIADAPGGVLFHCAAGKDRTGIGSAILLELAGVRDDEITADYHRTEAILRPFLLTRVEQFREQGISEERIAAIFAAPEEAMQATLEVLRERYGGAEGYLAAAGASRDAIAAARARMAGS